MLAKFSAQIKDANEVWGQLGIHISAGEPTSASVLDSSGNGFNESATVRGKINVFLTNDVPMDDPAGGKMVAAHTYAIIMGQDRTNMRTLAHELGHAFGIRGADDWAPRNFEEMVAFKAVYLWYELKTDLITAHLRTWGTFGLKQASDLREGASYWGQ